MSSFFISIQATYSHVSISLFSDAICIETIFNYDTRASSQLIPFLDGLLEKHNLNITNLSFIAVDRGPGAFTSLRVCIATVNGIAFAQIIPLIGIDGLDALSAELFAVYQNNKKPLLYISMLNAYNNDVYFVINALHNEHYCIVEKGCKKIDELLLELNQQEINFVFTGNASYLHKILILQILGERAFIYEPPLMTASAFYIGKLAYEFSLKDQKKTYRLDPVYMKTQQFSVKNQDPQKS